MVEISVEVKKLLSEIRELEKDVERKQRYGNDATPLIDTINRKTRLLELLLKEKA